ncbi:putative protease with the C-terminal PDZ domain [Belliella baltica DSM 15883]|uniref:Putative protease with the C-terminal PDZ domain n=1 Tax=Belliella baltica (strain DSM 15883 / CIP 108006 / LMG 21964 / BA134) TaxID=866536 RepID=I3Z585_BELBD|nr:peptidase [Belliella baltica]AFL84403.1 putative protease with the C-terminal PDZ domain [Belliella baltica DSM 15883]
MQYFISRNSNTSQFIQINLKLHCFFNEKINLQLAAWRPGRYELANYAQKIRGFEVFFKGNKISWTKKTKDLWQFESSEEGVYEIHYEFYTNQMDAGGSWSDESQLYLNFGNFIFEISGREKTSVEISIDTPQDFLTATALPSKSKNLWLAESYQHLIDSPLLASQNPQHYEYQASNTKFHLWFNGEIHFEVEQLIETFSSFTKCQIEAFGEFPAEDYHFIFQLLPYKHYHGVEHQFSTVITFGPAESLANPIQLRELIGVSSHELYHFWNVCRIRPKGITPYNLAKEVYLDSGLVLEGVTTYMGDLVLMQSGYFSLEEYCGEILDKLLQKEFNSFGWQNQSIVASSLDLWLDGYKIGIPDKKVSIYNRGALISLCLDLMLIKNSSSLSHVMREMWLGFGKRGIGYELADFERLVGNKLDNEMKFKNFFNQFVFGTEDLLPLLKALLMEFGVEITDTFDKNDPLLHDFGIKMVEGKVKLIHPISDAYQKLMLEDRILQIGMSDMTMSLENPEKGLLFVVERYGRKVDVQLEPEKLKVYPKLISKIKETNKLTELWAGKGR